MKAYKQTNMVLAGSIAVVIAFILQGYVVPSFAAPQLLAFDDLFPEPFFSDDNKKEEQNSNSSSGSSSSSSSSSSSGSSGSSGSSFGSSLFGSSLFGSSSTGSLIAPEQKKGSASSRTASTPEMREVDSDMRQQVQKVSSWLQEFSTRNHGNFPGVYSDTNTPARASQVQLTELVGANPYADSASFSPPAQELNGLSPGLSAIYSSDGVPGTASPIATDEWTSELQAQQSNRVRLGMDYSINSSSIEQWRNDAPDDWQAPPGTIVAKGNNQGVFYVWGAGRDGKPLKDSSGRQTYILAGRTSNTVQDQIAPNEGQ